MPEKSLSNLKGVSVQVRTPPNTNHVTVFVDVAGGRRWALGTTRKPLTSQKLLDAFYLALEQRAKLDWLEMPPRDWYTKMPSYREVMAAVEAEKSRLCSIQLAGLDRAEAKQAVSIIDDMLRHAIASPEVEEAKKLWTKIKEELEG